MKHRMTTTLVAVTAAFLAATVAIAGPAEAQAPAGVAKRQARKVPPPVRAKVTPVANDPGTASAQPAPEAPQATVSVSAIAALKRPLSASDEPARTADASPPGEMQSCLRFVPAASATVTVPCSAN